MEVVIFYKRVGILQNSMEVVRVLWSTSQELNMVIQVQILDKAVNSNYSSQLLVNRRPSLLFSQSKKRKILHSKPTLLHLKTDLMMDGLNKNSKMEPVNNKSLTLLLLCTITVEFSKACHVQLELNANHSNWSRKTLNSNQLKNWPCVTSCPR